MLENELYQWLQGYGIPVPEYRFVSLSEEPLAVDGHYPVALKIVSPRVVHKSDVGGVALNLRSGQELSRAKSEILESLKRHGIELGKRGRGDGGEAVPQVKENGVRDEGAGKEGWLVSRMYSGVELFFGVVRDAVFGKVILFGAGGTMVELFRDICYIDSEAGEEEIRRAVLGTKIGRLFREGFRGQVYDMRPVIDFIKKLQLLEVRELDCNPVVLTKEGLVVVDARAVLGVEGVQDSVTGNGGMRQDKEGWGDLGRRNERGSEEKQLKYIPELFHPGRTAIVGVSADPTKVGYALARNNMADADCYFVNSHLKELFGKKVYACVGELPAIDTAVLCIPAAGLEAVIEGLVPKGLRNVVIITAGFKEAGHDESFLKGLADRYGLNIIGPNCLGIYAEGKNLTFGPGEIRRGDVSLFSQSGAIIAELMDKAVLRHAGFRRIVSTGNMADVDFADLINSCREAVVGKMAVAGEVAESNAERRGDQRSGTINLYVEGVQNGKNLLRAIRGSQAPVRIFKAARTEAARRAAFSHTGNLAGNYEMFAGLVRGAGASFLRDINGLLYPYRFDKVLVITNAGGAGTVMSDLIGEKLFRLEPGHIEALDKVLPSNWSKNNPVDIIGDATHERFRTVLEVADWFGADVIYVLITPQFMTDTEGICRLFCQGTYRTKVFPVLLGGASMETARVRLREAGITFFDELAEAVSFL